MDIDIQSQDLETVADVKPVTRFKVPYENHVGAIIEGSKCRYQITSRCWEEADDLLIFSVTCLHDKDFEVQAFRNQELPSKLYLARKRRYKRLQRSTFIHDECEQSEMRIVVCRTFGGGGIDRHRISHERRKNQVSELDPSGVPFPQLAATGPTQARSLSGSGTSYAEIVTPALRARPSCPLEYLSTSQKGCRQREKRRDVREHNRDKAEPGICDTRIYGQSLIHTPKSKPDTRF